MHCCANSSSETPRSVADELRVEGCHGRAELSLALPTARGQELLESVESGLSSRVTFELRLYRRRSGLMGIFGDQVLGEAQVSHRGSYAPLTSEYLLEVTRRYRGRDAPVAQSIVVARYGDRNGFRDALLSVTDELVWRLADGSDIVVTQECHLTSESNGGSAGEHSGQAECGAVHGIAYLSVDNGYDFYVNGDKIGSGSNWMQTDRESALDRGET